MAGLRAEGDRSRLLESLADLATHYDQGALAAVIVVTDGAHNGSSIGWETLTETGIPIHSIGIGPADIPGDVELAELVLPSRASPHTQVAARVVIRHSSRTDGEEVRLRVLDGESVLAAESITLDPSSDDRRHGHRLPRRGCRSKGGDGGARGTVGRTRCPATMSNPPCSTSTASVTACCTWRESHAGSSSSSAGPRTRTTTSNSSPGFAPRRARPTARERRIRTSWPMASRVPSKPSTATTWSSSAACPPRRSTTSSTTGWLVSSPNAVAGWLALAGRHALDNGGWDVKPLAQALPVTISRPDEGSYGRSNYRVFPTDEGRRSVLTDIGGTGTREEAWQTLPMLADYQTLGTPKPGATVILEAFGGVEQRGADVVVRGSPAKPLLVTQPYGFGRTAVLATATTWRWRMRTPPEDTRHSLFWRHLIRHFAGAALPRRSLSLVADGDALDVRVALKSPRFEPLTDTAVTVQVTAPEGESFDVSLPRIVGEPAFGETIPAPRPGIYRVEMAGLAGPTPISEGGRSDALAALARVGEINLEQFGATLERAAPEGESQMPPVGGTGDRTTSRASPTPSPSAVPESTNASNFPSGTHRSSSCCCCS